VSYGKDMNRERWRARYGVTHDAATTRTSGRWLNTASKRERSAFASELRARFFDRDGYLSGFYSYLRDHSVNVELPPRR
jgi:hypothetical protein